MYNSCSCPSKVVAIKYQYYEVLKVSLNKRKVTIIRGKSTPDESHHNGKVSSIGNLQNRKVSTHLKSTQEIIIHKVKSPKEESIHNKKVKKGTSAPEMSFHKRQVTTR